MRRIFTTAGAVPRNACPTGVALVRPVGDAQPCIGGHVRGEPHRLADGYSWPASASEIEPESPVTFTVGLARAVYLGGRRYGLTRMAAMALVEA